MSGMMSWKTTLNSRMPAAPGAAPQLVVATTAPGFTCTAPSRHQEVLSPSTRRIVVSGVHDAGGRLPQTHLKHAHADDSG